MRKKTYVDTSNVAHDVVEKPIERIGYGWTAALERIGSSELIHPDGSPIAYDTFRAFIDPGMWLAREYKKKLKFGKFKPPNCLDDNNIGKTLQEDINSHMTVEKAFYEPAVPDHLTDIFRSEHQVLHLQCSPLHSVSSLCTRRFFDTFYGFEIPDSHSDKDTTKMEISADFFEWWTMGPNIESQTYNPDMPKFIGSPLFDHGKIFTDHYFKIYTPIPYLELNNFSNIRGLYAKTIPEYNFFIPSYEETIAEYELRAASGGQTATTFLGYPELIMPNIYIFLSEQEYLDETKIFESYGANGTPYSDFLTLNGKIKNVLQDVMVDKQSINVAGPTNKVYKSGATGTVTEKIKIGEKDVGDYFLKWSSTIDKTIINTSDETAILDYGFWLQNNQDKFKNTCFINYDTAIFEQAEIKKHLFPMHIGVEFSTSVVAGFSDLLYETRLMYSFMNFVHRRLNDPISHYFTELDEKILAEKATDVIANLAGNKEVKSWDVMNLSLIHISEPTRPY